MNRTARTMTAWADAGRTTQPAMKGSRRWAGLGLWAFLAACSGPADDVEASAATTAEPEAAAARTANAGQPNDCARLAVSGRIPNPLPLGAPCDVGSGMGACAHGGTVVCGGACRPTDPAIGDPTVWHITAAPNGSWDWDCDGAVMTSLHAAAEPADCSTFADSESCQGSPAIDYVTEDVPCGQQAVLFTRDCLWLSPGPTCLNTPAGHRITYQQCR